MNFWSAFLLITLPFAAMGGPGKHEILPDFSRPVGKAPLEESENGFCKDPVEAICKGDEGKESRRKKETEFVQSETYDWMRSTKIRELKDALMENGKYPRLKDEEWWDKYEAYIKEVYRALRENGDIKPADYESIRKLISGTVEKPGYFGPLSDAKAEVEKLVWVRDDKDIDAMKDEDVKRSALEALFEVCEESDGQNAVNVKHKIVVMCPHKVAKALHLKKNWKGGKNGLPLGIVGTIGHEVGHNVEFLKDPKLYEEMFSCLMKHHSTPTGARLVEHEFRPYMNEISADYWGAISLANALEKIPANERMAFMENELEFLCDAPGTEWEFNPPGLGDGSVISAENEEAPYRGLVYCSHFGDKMPTHPAGKYRIQLMGSLPFVRKAFGCAERPALNPPGCGVQGETPPGKY